MSEPCPLLDTVVVERIGRAFGDPAEDLAFRTAFVEVRRLCGRPL